MPGVGGSQVRYLVERRRIVVRNARRNGQLGDFYARASADAAAAGDYETACRHLELQRAFQDSSANGYRTGEKLAEMVLAARGDLAVTADGYRLAPRATNGTQPQNIVITRRNGDRRPRERRDGTRSSARSGDSPDDSGSSDEPPPRPAIERAFRRSRAPPRVESSHLTRERRP
jgi:hypothetical protein